MSRFSRQCGALAAGLVWLSASQAVASEVDRGKIDIASDSARCVIAWSGKGRAEDLVVDIPAPCALHKDLEGSIRFFDKGGRRIALIESSAPDPARGDSCITHVRGVIFDENGAELSEGISKLAACPPFQWDQKMFTGLF